MLSDEVGQLTKGDSSTIAPRNEDSSAERTGHPIPLSFNQEIKVFTQQIESLASSFPIVMGPVGDAARKATIEFHSFLESMAENAKENASKKSLTLVGDQIPKFRALSRNLETAGHAFRLIPRSFLVSLVSQYDSYIGRLIRLVLFAKPEILNSSERTLSFSDLVGFESIDKARDFLTEKEVESVIRQSHCEHFAWFEKKLNIPLRKELDAWPAFIELTERRNLFVHCDGVVSSQYLAVCRQHGVVLEPGCQLGRKFDVKAPYFEAAFECVYEIGVKLAHVLWRKLIPAGTGEADKNLNDLCVELLRKCKNKLAMKLLDFATLTLKKHSDEEYRRMFIINRAQAYKWSGANDECLRILDAEDWSATGDKFRLGVAVLRNDFTAASKFVKRLASATDIEESAYKDWPLFREFRESAEFESAYEAAYHRSFKVEELAYTDKPEEHAETGMEPPASEPLLDPTAEVEQVHSLLNFKRVATVSGVSDPGFFTTGTAHGQSQSD